MDGSTHSALTLKAVASRAWPAETEVKIVAAMDAKFWAVLADRWSSPWAWVGDAEEDGRTWADRAVAAMRAHCSFEVVRQGKQAAAIRRS